MLESAVGGGSWATCHQRRGPARDLPRQLRRRPRLRGRPHRHNVSEGWSVIVKGRALVLNTYAEIQEAERAQLLSWTATSKRRYVRVIPSVITGRRFRFGPEPDRD